LPDYTCSLIQPAKRLDHYWEHTVGSGHAPLALREDWQAQMRRCHDELGFRHVRFHALLSDELGTLVCEEEKLLYSFFNADRIFDFLLSIGMRPFVELSFMPEALASGHTTVFSYRGNVTPPRDYTQWATLIQKLVAHWVHRYGVAEVREWFFEVWNEPNLKAFWTGSQDEYFQLYRRTAEAVKAVDPSLKVGGPATANNEWIQEFLDFCATNSVPVDFVSTHHYPTDAFGQPGADTVTQLEHAPRDVMREQVAKSRDESRGLPLYYTEWNISSNPRDPMHDEPFAAAFITRIVMEAHGLAQGYSFWTFTDIFSENYFPSVPFHGGFGLLNLHGIAKPAYRAFQLLHRLGTEFMEVHGTHETVDVWVVRKGGTVTILLTNLAMPRHPIQTELVNVRLSGTTAPRAAFIERIDEDHANPRKLWHAMGEPEYLSPLQVSQLEAASVLRKDAQPLLYDQGNIDLKIDLPPQSVAAITIEL
jgi:xylan 1,4-beta-xylosidase